MGGHPLRTRVLLGGAGLILALGTVEVVRWHGQIAALQDAQSKLASAQSQLKQLGHAPTAAGIARIDTDLRAAAADLGPESSRVAASPEMSVLAHLPGIAGQVKTLRQLRVTGAQAVSVAQLAMPTAEAIVAPGAADAQSPVFARLVSAVDRDPDLQTTVDSRLDQLSLDLDHLGAMHPWGPLGSTRTNVLRDGTKLATSSRTAVDAAFAIHAALGGGAHKYLLLLGNPAEQRPGGGFMGVIGTVSTNDGAITSTVFTDPNSLMGKVTDQPIPRPLKDYLFHDVPWDVADSNWSADFPTSAREVSTFWTEAEHEHVDGVISIDPEEIANLLKVIGTVHTPGYTQPITAQNVLLQLNYAANKIRPGDPGKAFLADFGKQLVAQLESAPPSKTGALVSALAKGIPGRHLVLYVGNPAVQRVVVAHHLDGGLGALPGAVDQLTVTDANLSGGKNDLFVTRSTNVSVTLGPNGVVHHLVTLHYTQPAPSDSYQRRLQPGSGGAYRDYIQLFASAGATVTSVTLDGAPGSPEDVSSSLGLTDIALFTIIAPGQSRSIVVGYDTHPASVPATFVLGKQIQSLPHQVTAMVTWADGRVSHASALRADAPLTLSTP